VAGNWIGATVWWWQFRLAVRERQAP
jgi:hypothetical protein